MTIINLDYNLEDVKDEFEPLPVGDYFAKIDKCELVKSSTDKDMLKIQWVIVEGEFEGRRLFDNVVLSVAWKVKQYAELAGIASGAALNTEDFVETEAILGVIQEEYDGSIQNRIKRMKAA